MEPPLVEKVSSVDDKGDDDNNEDFVLEFRDRVRRKYCLILKDYDGKGIFIIRDDEDPSVFKVIGLTVIVHTMRPRDLLYPHTIKDIVRKYVKHVSIFEESSDRMNLMTDSGERMKLSQPPWRLFRGRKDTTVTLYLQNTNYLKRRIRHHHDKKSTARTSKVRTSPMTTWDSWIITVCSILVLLLPICFYSLILLDTQKTPSNQNFSILENI